MLRALRMENGGKYMSNRLCLHFIQLGIVHQQTVLHNIHRNDTAERFNCALMDVGGPMLDHEKLFGSFWAEALSVAVYMTIE